MENNGKLSLAQIVIIVLLSIFIILEIAILVLYNKKDVNESNVAIDSSSQNEFLSTTESENDDSFVLYNGYAFWNDGRI